MSLWSCLFSISCSCVVDLVVRDDNMWLKRKLSWHWRPTCEPRSAPCIPSLQVVVTLNVQSPRLTPRWHTSCKGERIRQEGEDGGKKVGENLLEQLSSLSLGKIGWVHLIFLFRVLLWVECFGENLISRYCLGQRILVALILCVIIFAHSWLFQCCKKSLSKQSN